MSGSVLSPRTAALEVLQDTLRRGRPFDDAFSGHSGLAQMTDRDRAFVHLLVATVLRRLGQIDALIAAFLERPLPVGTAAVQESLRLGVAQLMFLKTPPHAAVDTTVKLIEETGHAALKGLANALLRRVAREGEAILAGQDAPRLNTPDWLWDSWVAAYGEDTARAIGAANMAEPPLDFSVKDDTAKWAEKLGAAVLATGTLRRPGGSQGGGGIVSSLPGFADGAWWIQDAAAALPVKLLGDVAGKAVIELCAAPGGKTAQLSAAGAEVRAVELWPPRIEILRKNLKRLHLDAIIIGANATRWRPSKPVPFVLLDAPCTATGAMRRHPDIARLKTPQDVTRMAALQDQLLDAAAEMVAPGGVLVYCTCSLQPEEGPQRIAAMLARNDSFAREKIGAEELNGLAELISPEGDLRTLPCHLGGAMAANGGPPGGLDGFYAARLRRKA